MNLIVTITKSPEGVSLDRAQHVFGEEGGAIGRSDKNSWALKDPERYISSHHCSIEFENGIYYLADYSTNGTYVNHSDQPVGNGERVALHDGMSFSIGDYEFSVKLAEVNPSAPKSAGSSSIPGVTGPFARNQQDQQLPSGNNMQTDDDSDFARDFSLSGQPSLHVPMRFTPQPEPVIPGQDIILDPLQAFEQINRRKNPGLPVHDESIAFAVNQGDHAPLSEQAFTPPKTFMPSKPTGMDKIPEDWDRTEYGFNNKPAAVDLPVDDFDDDIAAVAMIARKSKSAGAVAVNVAGNVKKAAAARQQQNPANQTPDRVVGKPVIPQSSTDVRPRVSIDSAAQAVDNDLIAAMGLDKSAFAPEQLAQLNHVVGEFVRHTVEGLLKVLRARSTIKNELRLGVTTVQPRDNNPMKFSVDVDDALEHLFVRQGKGYLPPIASVNESFETILDHQVAVLAGMRAAFKSLLHKFDPVELTRRFDTKSGSGIFSGGKKQRYWEAYNEFFNEQVQDLDNSFQHLFGDEFVKAYESQLLELSIARKQNKQES
ncbi:MAG: type VI secretion system-associated FHA domain protein TagH [Gammaproteobacteria bacterium]|nr:type VI secretion system-associated FHA domain protein TagH [Gammaproteobacteria bacterium]